MLFLCRGQRALLGKVVAESRHCDLNGGGSDFCHNLVYQTAVDRLSGGDIAATHHQTERLGHAGFATPPMKLAHKSLRTAIARQQIQIDFRLAKLRVFCRDHIGAGQYQLVTATQCRAIDRRDHGFAKLLQSRKCRLGSIGRCAGRF